MVNAHARAGAVGVGAHELRAVSARALVEKSEAGLELRDACLRTERAGVTARLSASAIHVERGRVVAPNIVVEGLGRPIRAGLTSAGSRLWAQVDAPAVDLARIGRLASLERTVRSGTLRLAADVTVRPEGPEGRIDLDVHYASFGSIEGGTLSAKASLRDEHLVAAVRAGLGDAGHLELETERLTVQGNPLRIESWRRAAGWVAFDADLDLAEAATVLPPDLRPQGELSGRVTLSGMLGRRDPAIPPELSVHAHTRGLNVLRFPGLRGMDFGVDLRSDAPSGLVAFAARAYDPQGLLAALDAKALVPFEKLFASPDTAYERLMSARFGAKLLVPRRNVADLPDVLRSPRIASGAIEAELSAEGTAADPRVSVTARMTDMLVSQSPLREPADVLASLTYDGSHAKVSGSVSSGGRPALDMLAQVDVGARDLLRPSADGPLPWRGAAHVRLARFPLEILGPLIRSDLGGYVSGEAVLEGLH